MPDQVRLFSGTLQDNSLLCFSLITARYQVILLESALILTELYKKKIFVPIWRSASPGNNPLLISELEAPYAENMEISIQNGRPSRFPIKTLILIQKCFREAMITDELCPASIKKYTSSFRTFLAVIGHKDLTELNNDDFNHFIFAMKEKGAGNSRIANVIASMKWIISRLERDGQVFPHLDLSTIKKPRIIKQETNYLTEDEVSRFLSGIARDIEKRTTVKNIRFMALSVFLLQTGARIGEALSINIADIDRHSKEVRIIGKGSKPRSLFLRDETLYWIDRYLSSRGDTVQALFATQDGTSRWKQTDVGRSFRRYKQLSGIKKDFVIHTFRHTFATQYLMKGAGINVVQTALGHSDPVTTLKYYAAAVEKAKVREMINDRRFDFITSLTVQA